MDIVLKKIKKPSYDTVFNIVLFLLFLTIFSLERKINSVYYLLVFVGIFAWWKKSVHFKDIPLQVRRYIYILLILVAVIIISASLYNPSELFKWRLSVYRDLILFPLVLIAFQASNIKVETFLKTVVLAGVIMTGFWVAMILIDQPERKTSWLIDPSNRGNIGVSAAVICVLASAYFKDTKWKLVGALGTVTGIFLSILSHERGGWVALLVVSITLFFIFMRINKSAIKVFLPVFIIVCITIFIFWDDLPIAHRAGKAITSLQLYFSGENKATSAGIRLEMWRASWYAFVDKPLFGWGWNNTNILLAHYKDLGVIDEKAIFKNFGHLHNQYGQFLAELGLIGFSIFMAAIIYPLIYLIKNFFKYYSNGDVDSATICLIPIILCEAILVCCLFDDTLSQRHFLYLLIIITSFVMAYIHRDSATIESIKS
ncbi:O-antigen ligase family protein [Kaarinaea lacus]